MLARNGDDAADFAGRTDSDTFDAVVSPVGPDVRRRSVVRGRFARPVSLGRNAAVDPRTERWKLSRSSG